MARSLQRLRWKTTCSLYLSKSSFLQRSQHSNVVHYETNNEAGVPSVSEYPPVKPRFPGGNQWGSMPSKVAWLWEGQEQEVRKLVTAQEKIDYLTKESFRTWKFPDVQIQPKMLDYQLYIMKTYRAEGLPEIYRSFDVSQVIKRCKISLEELLETQAVLSRDRFMQKRFVNAAGYSLTHNSVKEILNMLLECLSTHHDHLLNSQFDDTVTVKAFWDRYGVKRLLPTARKCDPNYEQQNNSRFQAEHLIIFQLRTENPLPEFYPRNHEMFTNKALSCPELAYYPTVLGQFMENIQHSVSTGAKMGSPCEFTLLSVLLSNHYHLRKVNLKSGQKYAEESRIGYGITNSFASAVAQAYYQGFNTFEELTYPFTTQTIVTDGQYYTFFAYQLNTLHLWLDDEANPLKNICWVTGPHKLYDRIEDGKVKGFDDSVLEHIVKFLCIKPVDRGIDLRPNLGKEDDKLGVSEYIERKKLLVEYEEPVQYAPER